MADTKSLGDRIRDWDDWVEDGNDPEGENAGKPFEGGIMLAVATLFDAWDAPDRRDERRVLEAMNGLRETVEAVIA